MGAAYLILLIIVLLNIWVWFFPKAFVRYMQLGKGAKVENVVPALKDVWKFVEHPSYIWFPRIAFALMLVIVLLMIFLPRFLGK